ncbi:DUF300-domain-containing protein [Trametopsis cervina]|nr:DUF300-domain-containing protein [Trametopsis cervina]
MADIVNGRCHNEKAPQDSPPLFQHGKLVLQLHHIGWLVSTVFTIAAIIISFWLMGKHLQWYTNKTEQRYIVRILLLVPLYAVISLASYLFWNHSTPLLLLRDCYESIVLTAFFYLLLTYISPDPEEQKEIFRKNGLSHFNDRLRQVNGEQPRKWMFPLGAMTAKPQDGLYFLQLMKWGVLQYCVIRPTTTLAAVILDYVGLYCEDSWSPGWGHIYITVIVSVSVSVSMYCLIQLYATVSIILAPQKPLLKMVAIKAVVFLTFWQATMLSVLATFGLVKDTQYMTAENINIGIGAIMETVEMTLFAILHLKAFSYKPYVISSHPTKRLPALIHAFNFMETFRELRDGTIYLWYRMHGRETDKLARRQGVLEGVFGKSRIEIQGGPRSALLGDPKASSEKELAVEVAADRAVHIEESQWFGAGDDYTYGPGYRSNRRREKSDGLEVQIERELAKRGYGRRYPSTTRPRSGGYDLINVPVFQEGQAESSHRREKSWWNIYGRFSQPDPASVSGPTSVPGGESSRNQRRKNPSGKRLVDIDVRSQTYDDLPPPSSIRRYRESKMGPSPAEVSPPLLSTAFSHRSPPAVLSSFAVPTSIDKPPAVSNPQLMSLSRPALSTSPSDPNRPDSFLGRVFPPMSDASNSAENLTPAGTSSQSHRTQVRLTPGPELVPTTKHKAVTRKPVRYDAPTTPPAIFVNAQIEAAPMMQAGPPERNRAAGFEAHHWPPPQSSPPGIPISPMPAYPSHDLPPPPHNRYIPRRDQIVLPAPLASAADSRSSPRDRTQSHQAQPLPDRLPHSSSGPSQRGLASPPQLRRSTHTNVRRYSQTLHAAAIADRS